MANLNKVMLIGRCGNDPKSGTTATGDAWASVSIATSEHFKDKSGTKQEQTEWHDLMFYRRLGEIAQQYIRKGMLIFVEGKLRTSRWKDDSGVEKQRHQIIVEKMEMLSSGKRDDDPTDASNTRPVRSSDLLDDIPF